MPGTQQDIVPQQVPLHGPGQQPLPCSSDRTDPKAIDFGKASVATAGMVAETTCIAATGAGTARTIGGAEAASVTTAWW